MAVEKANFATALPIALLADHRHGLSLKSRLALGLVDAVDAAAVRRSFNAVYQTPLMQEFVANPSPIGREARTIVDRTN